MVVGTDVVDRPAIVLGFDFIYLSDFQRFVIRVAVVLLTTVGRVVVLYFNVEHVGLGHGLLSGGRQRRTYSYVLDTRTSNDKKRDD